MKLFSGLLAISFALTLFSCNNAATKEETTATDTATTAVATEPVETKPAFTPFKIVVIQHKVKNFAKSEAGYFNNDSLRQAYGITHYAMGRLLRDSNTVFVIDRIEDVEKSKSYFNQANVKNAMAKAGVSSAPGYSYGEVVRSESTPPESAYYLTITHHVKDFDGWLKAFDAEGAAARAANGIAERGIARDLNDPNMVTLIFAVTDMEKAKARIASPELKKIMTDAGVDSPPTIRWLAKTK